MLIPLALLLVTFSYVLVPNAYAAEKRLRILVTNDDGFQSEGIQALTRKLAAFADVLTVAPVDDQSGASQSTTVLNGETWVVPQRRDGKLIGYEVEGTPADAVRFGLKILGREKKFDFVVSGINKGGNVGLINLYSGTVGAAMEAILHGIPALAVSQSSRRIDNFELSASLASDVVRQMAQNGVPKDVLLSLNVPRGKVRGIKVTPVTGLLLRVTGFKHLRSEGHRLGYKPVIKVERSQPAGGDSAAYLNKFATLTPIAVDRTAYSAIPVLQRWDLTLPKPVRARPQQN
jgi:5'-nucleotidase